MKKLIISAFFLNVMICIYSQIPTNGLVAWYPFNGNVNDSSGNGNNLTAVGGQFTTDRFGNPNNAYSFNGISDYLYHTSISGSTSYTFSLWGNLTSYQIGGNNSSMYFADGYGNGGGYGFNYGEFNKDSGVSIISYGINGNITNSFIVPKLNTWNHYVITQSSDTFNLYINDTLKSTGTSSFDPITGYFSLGACNGNSTWGNFLNGKLDDVRIYNRVLKTSEIKSLYQEVKCINRTYYDTTIYHISDTTFKKNSPITYFINTDSLKCIYGCDSTVNKFISYKYSKNYETIYDTIKINDTIKITKTINDTIFTSVEDTLKFNVSIPSSTNPQLQVNQIKVYPNPTGNIININTGNYSEMKNYQLKIINTQGQTIWTTIVSQQLYTINLSSFGSSGLYYLQIFDENGKLIEVKKIVLLKYITEN